VISFVVIGPVAGGCDGSGSSASVQQESEGVRRENEREERVVEVVSKDVVEVEVEVERGDRSSKSKGARLDSKQKDEA